MKKYSEVSRRYAKALFELTGAHGEEVLAQLRKVQAAISNPKIKDLLESPVLSRKEKEIVVSQLISNLKLSDVVESFLRLLANKDRMSLFDEIETCFEMISDEKNNVLRGEVVSAEGLSKKDKEEVEAAISKFTGYQLLLEYKEDPTLIGGILAKVGSYTFDGTLNTQLMKLKEAINRSN